MLAKQLAYLVFESWMNEMIEGLRQDYVDLEGGEVAAMRYPVYPSIRALLDDLYLQYIEKCYNVDPFTYGDQWIYRTESDRWQKWV